jgi:hypothetical protein
VLMQFAAVGARPACNVALANTPGTLVLIKCAYCYRFPMRYTLAIRPEESRRNDWFLPCVPKNRVSLRCPKTRQKTELLWTRRSSSKGTQSPQRRRAAERDQKSFGSTQDHTGLRIASLPHELPPEIFDSY